MTTIAIHRIRSVAPDLDVLALAPTQARLANNMRFSASGESQDQCSQFVKGNVLIDNPAIDPTVSIVVGTLDVGEEDKIFYAEYREVGTHRIWEYSLTGGHKLLVEGAFFNFKQGKYPERPNYIEEYNVDMCFVLGNLLLTDNINPKWHIVVGEIDKYPKIAQEWHYTQIKKKPLYPLEVTGAQVRPNELSLDINPNANTQGYQYSFYYKYLGGCSSRLAPASPLFFGKTANLGIPFQERRFLQNGTTTIQKIVYCYRAGNDGVWKILKEVDVSDKLFYRVEDIETASQVPVPSNITDSDYDLVPLVSNTHEVVEGRVMDSNYVLDYDNWDKLKIKSVNFFVPQQPNGLFTNRTFLAGGRRYRFGIELLDFYGRKIGVIGEKIVRTPDYVPYTTPFKDYDTFDKSPIFNDYANELQYNAEVELEGELPEWAASARIVYSKCLDIITYYKTRVLPLYWYQDTDGSDVLQDRINDVTNPSTPFVHPRVSSELIFKGVAIVLLQGEPINFTNADNAYVRFSAWTGRRNLVSFNVKPEFVELIKKERKIEKQIGNIIYVPFSETEKEKFEFQSLNAVIENNSIAFHMITGFAVVELYTKRKVDDGVFYTNTAFSLPQDINLTYTVYGDLFISLWEKTMNDYSFIHARDQGQSSGGLITVKNRANLRRLQGYFTAMTPVDIFGQTWDSDIGEANVVTPQQEAKRIPSDIIYSNQVISGLKVNNINQYTADNIKQLPTEMGAVTKLIRTGGGSLEPGVLIAVGRFQWCSLYPGSSQIFTSTGDSLISTTDKVLPTVRLLKNTFGVSSQKSVHKSPTGHIFAYSNVVRDHVRYTEGGLDALGANSAYANDIRRRIGDGKGVQGYYDQLYEETVIIDKFGQAYCYNNKYRNFDGRRDISLNNKAPDRVCALSNQTFFFMDGKMYVSDIDSPLLTFFGEEKRATMQIVTNIDASSIKNYQAISIDGYKPIETILQTDIEAASTVNKWIQRKDTFEAAILRNANSPGGLKNGGIFEGNILISTFVWRKDDFGNNEDGRIKIIKIYGTKSVVQ